MVKQVTLKNSNRYALVDDDDYPDVSQYDWYLTAPNGAGSQYVSSKKNWSGIKLHQQIMGFPHYRVGFKNGDRLDCRKGNLIAKKMIQSNSKSGYPGISRNGDYWQSYHLSFTQKRRYLGTFKTIDAALAKQKGVSS